jgi:uncharacterized protein YukE
MVPDDTDESSETEVRVNVRTTKQRRDRWKEFADEHQETRYMSDLIHRAVREYIQRHEGDSDSGRHHGATDHGGGLDDETATALTTAVDGMDERLNTVVEALQSIDNRLEQVEEHTAPEDDDVTATEIVGALPPFRPHTEAWETARSFMETYPFDAAWRGTPDAVADHLDVSEDRVAHTLSHVEDTPDVETGVVDGTKRYWSAQRSRVSNLIEKEVNPPISEHLREAVGGVDR